MGERMNWPEMGEIWTDMDGVAFAVLLCGRYSDKSERCVVAAPATGPMNYDTTWVVPLDEWCLTYKKIGKR